MNRTTVSTAGAVGILAALTVVASAPALAHVGHHHGAPAAGGLLAGLTHPLLGLDHLIAMLAVGVWSARLADGEAGRRAVWALPVAFVAAVALGAGVGLSGGALPGVELFVGSSVVVLGLLVAAAAVLPLWAGALLVAAFGLFHGHAHGTEMPAAAAPLLYGLGFLAATAGLHLAGLGLGAIARDGLRLTALRVAGGLAAVTGVVLLAA